MLFEASSNSTVVDGSKISDCTWNVTLWRNTSDKGCANIGDAVPCPDTLTRTGEIVSASGNQPICVPGCDVKAERTAAAKAFQSRAPDLTKNAMKPSEFGSVQLAAVSANVGSVRLAS